MKPAAAPGESGSVLAEALVAILIVAAMSGLWFETLGSSARQQQALADRQRAMLVARSQLAAVGITTPLAPGETSGSDAGLDWRISVGRYPDAGDGIVKIAVVVARPAAGDLAGRFSSGDLVRLQTLRLGQ